MPILNQRDYRLAKARLTELERVTSPDALVERLKAELPASLTEARLTTVRIEAQKMREQISAYEKLRDVTADNPDAIEADELGLLPILARISRHLSQKDLAEILGLQEQQIQRYERQRYSTISLERYQRVLSALGVEVHPRLTSTSVDATGDELGIDLTPDLLRELRKRAWVDLPKSLSKREIRDRLDAFVVQNRPLAQTAALNRRTRTKQGVPDAVLHLWTARVLNVAADRRSHMKGRFNIGDASWLTDLVRLSVYPDGPLRAVEMLREHGIILIVEPHLPGTALDGAAFLLAGGIPVVALTLRHDRIDNFWFTLLHELAHVFLHFNRGLADGFIDDDLQESRISAIEQEADVFARNTLIPDELWRGSVARFSRSDEVIERFARSISIHPAIVAGRIRNERDFKIFSGLTGSGQVRTLFVGYAQRSDDVSARR
jgi:HTH-type transcriptional regulator/antitoxin HigA